MKAIINSTGNIFSNEDASLTIGMMVTYNGRKFAISANVTTLGGCVERIHGWHLLSAGKTTKAMDFAVREAISQFSL